MKKSGTGGPDKETDHGRRGFTDLMKVERQIRHISTKNCRLLGAGRSSNVYRLDSETIVKKYNIHVPVEMILREMELARKTFVFPSF